ncbi:hypothetical protein LX87_05033 [Larkinella arboricola]|uniref:Uncharacterized protein n=1 Tax=Larkinella arboricola TaxID=643671 RepID=A0A327WQD6_LARAB|nr:hypothetical protein [Larkinella arboricola]RAJ92702.1 hypothetical protein LX87_05033 [Larkinella arboricola]
MSKTEFSDFVLKTLEELIQYAEVYAGNVLPRKLAFKWMSEKEYTDDRQEVLNKIVQAVYVSEDLIYPCVDLVVKSVKKNRLQIEGRIAGYEPRPFQKGWSGRMGPFIYGIGFAVPTDKTKVEQIKKKLIQKGLLPS